MKLVLTKRLLGIPVKVVTVELPDVSVSVSVTATVGADGGRALSSSVGRVTSPGEPEADSLKHEVSP